MLIRSIVPNDAEQFLHLCLQLDKEMQFMLLEPGERVTTVMQQQAQIERIVSQGNQQSATHPLPRAASCAIIK